MSGARIFGKGRFAPTDMHPGAKRAAAAARPVATGPNRRALLAKVHLGAKEIGLAEDDYRAILLDVTGQSSAAKCSDGELVAVLERFRSRGWKPAQPSGQRTSRPADHGPATKARALWISLHHLGAIADPSEAALEAFAKRQLKCPRLQWADQGLMYRLIEAEKAIAQRHGWDQSLEGVAVAVRVTVLKRRLVEAILGKLVATELAPACWTVDRAAFEFAGMQISFLTASASELDIVARKLGDRLREGTR
ncbi:MAG: regulatory protein GemA [Pseudomonadota bacterium]